MKFNTLSGYPQIMKFVNKNDEDMFTGKHLKNNLLTL